MKYAPSKGWPANLPIGSSMRRATQVLQSVKSRAGLITFENKGFQLKAPREEDIEIVTAISLLRGY